MEDKTGIEPMRRLTGEKIDNSLRIGSKMEERKIRERKYTEAEVDLILKGQVVEDLEKDGVNVNLDTLEIKFHCEGFLEERMENDFGITVTLEEMDE